jgi:hypothetical protein
MWKKKNAYRMFVGIHEIKRPLGRCRHRWENIKINLHEIGWLSTGLMWLWIETSGEPLRTQ